MTVLAIFLGLAVGLIVGYLLQREQTRKVHLRCDEQTALAQQTATERDVLRARLSTAEQQNEEQKTFYESQMAQLKTQQREQLQQQLQLIKAEMTAASERILRERSTQLSASNQEQLGQILTPLKENIRQMREAVEKSDRAQTVTMERLDASIKENLRQAQQVGERADKLAQALTSENKTQGNFGELRLKQLLEEMGLEEGIQFEEQTTLRDEHGHTLYDDDDGHRMVPDVILHFPDHRDVIIDSKMSFKAFQDYYAAQTDDERESALRRHIASVRQHVNELSRKNYSRYIRADHHRLDFVMMYVFSESALQLALSREPSLWREAYDQGVIIAGSQTLFVMLRVLEMTWKQVRQVENQQEIMKTANVIIERVQLFYERFLRVDDQLHRTQDAFDELKRSTASSGLSITTAATKLLKYGAQENPKRKQRLPKADSQEEALPTADSQEEALPTEEGGGDATLPRSSESLSASPSE